MNFKVISKRFLVIGKMNYRPGDEIKGMELSEARSQEASGQVTVTIIEPELKAEFKVESKDESNPEPKDESNPEPKPESKVKLKAESKTEPKDESKE